MPGGFFEQVLCLALLCQAEAWEEVGKILYFPPPLADDIPPCDAVANTELENCRQQALGKMSVLEDDKQNIYCRNYI